MCSPPLHRNQGAGRDSCAVPAATRAFSLNAGTTLARSANAMGTGCVVNNASLGVAGKAMLGGSLSLNFSGTYAKGQKFVLISAAGGLSGDFSSISSSGAMVVGGRDHTSFFVIVQ
jgi:hypothetical protein